MAERKVFSCQLQVLSEEQPHVQRGARCAWVEEERSLDSRTPLGMTALGGGKDAWLIMEQACEMGRGVRCVWIVPRKIPFVREEHRQE